MALLTVAHADGKMRLGSYSRKALTPSGCNEPFKNAYWCPKKKWFSTEPCPFANRFECISFSRFAGSF